MLYLEQRYIELHRTSLIHVQIRRHRYNIVIEPVCPQYNITIQYISLIFDSVWSPGYYELDY